MVGVQEGDERVAARASRAGRGARPPIAGARDLARVLARVDPPLGPPGLGAEVVERAELHARLVASDAPIAMVVAPAGYG
ncbi:MAG TPA: hypothetical protein VFZ17_13515, partial [Acidimicrobiia bacterium]|nr:hypothetical protein [Acidimicrobiia bacterium]